MSDNVEAEYLKLEGLFRRLEIYSAKFKKEETEGVLHEAAMSVEGTTNADARSNLEDNLRLLRGAILSDLTAIIKQFG